MSLRAFHLFFIAVSTMLAAFVALVFLLGHLVSLYRPH